jgi:HAD superfamily hydrolase (TIGR01509 family)
MLKFVLFDLDDTLFDHRHSSRSALTVLQEHFAEHLSAVSLDELERHNLTILNAIHVEVLSGAITPDEARARRFAQLLGKYGATISEEEQYEVGALYRTKYQSSRRPSAGAIAILHELRKRGLKTGVVSNNLVEEQNDKLQYCGLADLLDIVVISEAVGVSKPDPRIFEIALERAGCTPEEAVMVGDAWGNDVLGARAAGIRAVWFNCYNDPRPNEDVPEITSFEDMDLALNVILADAFQESKS